MNRAERRRAEKELRKGSASKAVQDVYKSAWEKGSSETVYSMAVLACAALYDQFDFREIRLMRFAQALNALGTGNESVGSMEMRLAAKYPKLTAYLKGGENNV